MTFYRSLEVIKAVQYTGEDIPGVTCSGTDEEFRANGCDPSRRRHIHVHTQAIGGMTVLQSGDWIFPLPGGPFGVASDQKFCGRWEVPVIAPEPFAAEPALPEPSPAPTILPDLKKIDALLAEANTGAEAPAKETTEE